MKKIYCACMGIMMALLAAGCRQDGKEMVSVRKISIDKEEAIEIINNQPNMTADDSLQLQIPDNLTEVSDFKLMYSNRQNNQEFYDDFVKIFEKIYPGHEMNENLLFYYGKRSHGNENGPLISFLDYQEEIFSDQENILYFYYDEAHNGTGGFTEWTGQVFLEATSPVCNELFRFNKGKAYSFIASEDNPIGAMEIFFPAEHFEYIETYSPDSTDSFKMMDKETPINEAVKFFEDYINSLKEHDPAFEMRVVDVDVMEMDDGVYGYAFTSTLSYNDIIFDYITSGTNLMGSGGYAFKMCDGFMVESTDVNSVDGVLLSCLVAEPDSYTKMISLKTAAEIISSSLSDQVTFKAIRADLIYSSKEVEGVGIGPEEYKQETTAAWKITLYNTNDNHYYFCYVNAKDGENFHYYTSAAGTN